MERVQAHQELQQQEGEPQPDDPDRVEEDQPVHGEDVHDGCEQGQQHLEEEEVDQPPAAQFPGCTSVSYHYVVAGVQ